MEQINIDDPVILIRISQAYRENISPIELYDYTRSQWKLNPERAKNAKYGLAVYNGIIKEVYKIIVWYPAGTTFSVRTGNELIERKAGDRMEGRYEFIGNIAKTSIRNKYKNKNVAQYFKQGNSNPIMYVNV